MTKKCEFPLCNKEHEIIHYSKFLGMIFLCRHHHEIVHRFEKDPRKMGKDALKWMSDRLREIEMSREQVVFT